MPETSNHLRLVEPEPDTHPENESAESTVRKVKPLILGKLEYAKGEIKGISPSQLKEYGITDQETFEQEVDQLFNEFWQLVTEK